MTELTYDQQLHLALLDHTVSIIKMSSGLPQPAGHLENQIKVTYAALLNATGPVVEPAPAIDKPSAVRIQASIGYDHLVSFEDGKMYKTLKRHLSKAGLTPDEYRVKWGLPADYPMVAPAYSARRSELAKASGLGKK